MASEAIELVERLRKEIGEWERAYPLSAFPEPDLARAATVLKEAGMTLDSISASNMRHVVSRLAPSLHETLDTIERLIAEREKLVGALEELLVSRGCDPYEVVANDPVDGHPLNREGRAAANAEALLSQLGGDA